MSSKDALYCLGLFAFYFFAGLAILGTALDILLGTKAPFMKPVVFAFVGTGVSGVVAVLITRQVLKRKGFLSRAFDEEQNGHGGSTP